MNIRLSQFTIWRLARASGHRRPELFLYDWEGRAVMRMQDTTLRLMTQLYPGVAVDTAVNMLLTDTWRLHRRSVIAIPG